MTKAEFVDKLAEKGEITKKLASDSHRSGFFIRFRRVGRW